MPMEMVSLNVGGHRFSTSVTTLCSDPHSMLAKMFSNEWQKSRNSEDCVFIDRDGRHFHYVLNYLRDGPKSHIPDDRDLLCELLNEAEYFQIRGLQHAVQLRLTGPSKLIKENDVVCWRPDAIEPYWRPFALSMIHGVREAFFYDKVGKKYNDKETLAMCIGCRHSLSLSLVTVFDYRLRYEEWEPLKHHMKHMRGVVLELVHDSCCVVDWCNGSTMHVPNTALMPADFRDLSEAAES